MTLPSFNISITDKLFGARRLEVEGFDCEGNELGELFTGFFFGLGLWFCLIRWPSMNLVCTTLKSGI